MNVYIWKDWEYEPTSNTLLYVTNDGDIIDHSQYSSNHSMNWYGTPAFETLPSGRKVVNLSGNNMVYCTRFAECIGKSAFTMHIRMKNKNTTPGVVAGWRDRNTASMSTTDRWGALIGDNGQSAVSQHVSRGATNGVWQDTGTGIAPDTSNFYLYTFTINGKTVNIYKNASLVRTYTGSYNIIGGSNTGGKFFYGGFMGYSTTTEPGALTQMYAGEIVVEDKVGTAEEIANYFNQTKFLYGVS